MKNIISENITDPEVSKIFYAANGDLELIKEKYAIISQFKKVNNLVGAMLQALKENWTTSGKTKGTFNSFTQREYNFKNWKRS